MRTLATYLTVLVGLLLLGQPIVAQNTKDYYKDINDALTYFNSNRATDKSFAIATLGLVGMEARKSKNAKLQQYLEKQGTRITVQGLLLDDPAVRKAANTAMSSVNPTLAGPVLSLVNGRSYDERLDGMKKLASLGSTANDAVPALVGFVKQARDTDKPAVVDAIATVGVRDAQVCELIAGMALKDPDPIVQKAALSALAKLPNGPSTNYFLQILQNSNDPALRLAAVRGLAQVAKDNPAAIQELERLAKLDDNPAIRKEAQAALKALQ